MKYLLKQLYKEAKDIRMRSSEKSSTRSFLLSYIEQAAPHTTPSPSPYFSYFSIRTYAATAIVAVIMIGSGISFAAEWAIPGDRLYSVKTNINEGVKSFLAVTPSASAEIQTGFIETRLQEIEKLAVRGELTEDAQAALEQKISAHITEFKTNVQKIENRSESKTVLERTSELESSLNAHMNVLSKISSVNPEVGRVASKVRSDVEEVTAYREEVQEKFATAHQSEVRGESLEVKRRDVEKKIGALGARVAAVIGHPELSERVSDAVRSLEEARKFMDENNLRQAFIKFEDAKRISGEVELTLNSIEKLNLPGTPLEETKSVDAPCEAGVATSTTSTSTISTTINSTTTSTTTSTTVTTSTLCDPVSAATSSVDTGSTTGIIKNN